jgi:uncharacterized protein (DUF1778 family)
MATKKKKKKVKKRPPQTKDGRLNLRIDPDLKEWIHEYARRHQTTVTSLTTDFFVHLRETEHVVTVRQI